MQRSRWLAMLVILAAVAAGGALGYGVARYTQQEVKMPCCGPNSFSYWDEVAKEWGITPEQRGHIDALLDRHHAAVSALYQPVRPQLDSMNTRARVIGDSTEVELRALLTPAQQSKMDALREDLRRRRDAWREQTRRDSVTRLRP